MSLPAMRFMTRSSDAGGVVVIAKLEAPVVYLEHDADGLARRLVIEELGARYELCFSNAVYLRRFLRAIPPLREAGR